MTDLETAILDILRNLRPDAFVLDEIHAYLVNRGWDVHLILPRHITAALVALTSAGLVRNEQSWRAVADAPITSEPKP